MEQRQKIYFRLEPDEDGYPPNNWESMWVQEIEPGKFQIDNIPFFVKGISYGDIVSAFTQEDKHYFQELLVPSTHSVVRVIAFDLSEVEPLRNQLRKLGCPSELSHIAQLFAVDIPPSVSIKSVRKLLDIGEKSSKWEYEEASIRQTA